MILFHTTARAGDLLVEGFRDLYALSGEDEAGEPVVVAGVFLADEIVAPEEAFSDVFEVEFPDGFPLDDFAAIKEDAPVGWRREWLVPADVLNRHATVRLGPPSPYA